MQIHLYKRILHDAFILNSLQFAFDKSLSCTGERKGLLERLQCSGIVVFAHFLTNVATVLSKSSLTFQRTDVMVGLKSVIQLPLVQCQGPRKMKLKEKKLCTPANSHRFLAGGKHDFE